MTRDEVIALSHAAADAAGIPRLLLLAAGCAESGLNPLSRRPVNAADDATYWPDVSGGCWQQTVRWDPDYHGGAAFPGEAEIARVLALQFDVERSAAVAAGQLKGQYHSDEPDAIFRALCRYNWPAGGGTPASAGVAADYRNGVASATKLLGGSPVPDLTALLTQLIALGKTQTGKPYSGPIVGQPESSRWGSPGFDCSSFVSWLYQQVTGGAIKLTAFTDAAHDQCDWEQSPAAGDVVFYHYADDSQPGVTFPHMGIWLSPTQVLDCRYPEGVGVHDHVTPVGPDGQGRYRVTMRPKGLAAVTPAPSPAPPPPDPVYAQPGQVGSGILALMVTDNTQPALPSIFHPLGSRPSVAEECVGLNGRRYFWHIPTGRSWVYEPKP